MAMAGLLAMQEPVTTAVLLCVLGALIAFSVLFSRAWDRLGVPVVLLFLLLGMLGGSEGLGGIAFDDYGLAVRIGTIALILILFDGGMNTSMASVRRVILPAGVLATVGVVLTAGLVTLTARLFGLAWAESLLLGAVVSSTDTAAVFAVLRGGSIHLEQRLARTIEVESCVNDPMAVILTLAMIEVIKAGGSPGWSVLLSVPVQLVIGAGVGIAWGYLCRLALNRAPISTVALFPALTLSAAFLSFATATLAQGSGFLAVFVSGLVLGNWQLAYRSSLVQIHGALAWMCQIGVFLMLGLLVFPSQLPEVAGVGLGIGLVLAVVARPLAVWLCMWPFNYPAREVGYIGWVGLRGAVPIILGTFPVLAGVERADRMFNLVFFIVVVSSVIPGSTIRLLTRRMGLDRPGKPTPSAVLEINARRPLGALIESYHITPSLIIEGATLAEVDFPPQASAMLIVRGDSLVPAKGKTRLLSGDHVYVIFRPEDRPLIELLFGCPEV